MQQKLFDQKEEKRRIKKTAWRCTGVNAERGERQMLLTEKRKNREKRRVEVPLKPTHHMGKKRITG